MAIHEAAPPRPAPGPADVEPAHNENFQRTLTGLVTGVPVWALDAARLEGAIVLRPDGYGRLVLADGAGVIAALFDPPGAAHAPARGTRSVVLLAVQAPGVDDLFVEEALWVAAAAL